MSPLPTPVCAAVTEFQQRRHLHGRDFDAWWQKAETTRGSVAKFIGARAEEIAFMGSASQAINVVAQGLRWRSGDNVILSDLEFPANIYPWLNLQRRGVEVRILPNVEGRLPPASMAAAMDGRTRLLSISHVQASTGWRSALPQLAELCRERGVLFAVDATQSLGAFPIAVDCGIDFLFGATFKWLLSPDGLGFLYCRRERLDEVEPASLGWAGMRDRHDYAEFRIDLPEAARRFEPGNPNFSALYGLDAALAFIDTIGVPRIAERLVELTGYLELRLADLSGVIYRSRFPAEHRSGIATFDVPDRQGLFRRLQKDGVLTALRTNGIRVSPHCYTRAADLDRLVSLVAEHVKQVRS